MKLSFPEPQIVTSNGKPVSVILPIDQYAELLERVEDSQDVAWLKKARKRGMKFRPLTEYLAERNAK